MSNKVETVKIGRTSFNKAAFEGMNEADFEKFCKDPKNGVVLPRGMKTKDVLKKVQSKTVSK